MDGRCTILRFLITDKIFCFPVKFQKAHRGLQLFKNTKKIHMNTKKSFKKMESPMNCFTLFPQSGKAALKKVFIAR
jgi:hypothetical protein